MSPAVHVQELLFGAHLGTKLLGKYTNVHIQQGMPEAFSKVVAAGYTTTSNVAEVLWIRSLSDTVLPIPFTFLLIKRVLNSISLCSLAIFASSSVKCQFGYVQISIWFFMLFIIVLLTFFHRDTHPYLFPGCCLSFHFLTVSFMTRVLFIKLS